MPTIYGHHISYDDRDRAQEYIRANPNDIEAIHALAGDGATTIELLLVLRPGINPLSLHEARNVLVCLGLYRRG